jgi:glucose/mannose transport system permease protein
MVVPAVLISTVLGALNGYVLTKWRFRGDTILFGLMLFACFIPFQIVLIPMARMLGLMGLAGTTPGLVLVHVVYGIGLHDALLPQLLRGLPDRARPRRADRRGGVLPDLLADHAAVVGADHRGLGDLAVHQHLERLPLRRLLRGLQSAPMTVALNNLVSSSTGVKEYNVHFAGAILAALADAPRLHRGGPLLSCAA